MGNIPIDERNNLLKGNTPEIIKGQEALAEHRNKIFAFIDQRDSLGRIITSRHTANALKQLGNEIQKITDQDKSSCIPGKRM